MSTLLHHHWCRRLIALVLILCPVLMTEAMALHLKDESHTSIKDYPFSVLILGDSQMAGEGWEGGYANCILEEYPNARILNLAQGGSVLAKGDLHAQWGLFLSEGFPMPDFILLDGGINDLTYIHNEEFEDAGFSLVKDAFCSLVEHIHETSPDTRIIYTLIPPLAEWKDSDNGPPAYEVQERCWKQMNILANGYDYITVLDLFSLNPFRYPCAECHRAYFIDSVHLSEAGYRKTFEYIDNILLVRLAKKLEANKMTSPSEPD